MLFFTSSESSLANIANTLPSTGAWTEWPEHCQEIMPKAYVANNSHTDDATACAKTELGHG
jgi:hypothetical protein